MTTRTPEEIAGEIVAGYWSRCTAVEEADYLRSAISSAVAAETERCAGKCDTLRDVALNIDLQTEPLLWIDGYEHGCQDAAAAIRAKEPT